MAREAFQSQLGIDIGGGVLLVTREKKRRLGKENNCGEDSHARGSHQLWLKQSVLDDALSCPGQMPPEISATSP